MRGLHRFKAGLLALGLALTLASGLKAQVTGLYYHEEEKDGRVYIFNTPETYKGWQASGDMGKSITLLGSGPNGETLVGENETAIDLYLFKHNLPAYERPTPVPAKPAEFPASKTGIRVFADISSKDNKDKATGIKSNDSGVGVDVKRTYVTFTQQFDKQWSAGFQSDIGEQGARRFDVFVKKAYIQYAYTPMATFRLGAHDTPWIPYVEGLYGLRYVEQTITDRLSFGASAEWGFHILGNNPLWGYSFTVGNGRGFSNPSRSKSVDFEGRLSFTPVKGLNLAVGGYSGKRGLETDTVAAKHTATRADALIAYNTDKFKIGAEFFQADNWNTVTATTKDKSDGFAGWGQFNLNTEWSVFGKYETAKPSKTLKPNLKETYFNAGLQWRLNKAFAASLVYKNDEVKGGTFSTGNAGTVGSVNAKSKGTYSEIGIFTVYDF